MYGWAERGRQLVVPWSGRDVRYSVTCCSDLTNPQGFVVSEPREDSNTALDFCAYVIQLIEDGTLVAGDYFVVDNASIHNASDMLPILDELFDALDMRLIFLPTYSPELNPVEMIFGKAKSWLRNQRCDGPSGSSCCVPSPLSIART